MKGRHPFLGVNLDPTNPGGRPPVRELGELGWARVIARPGPQLTVVANYMHRLHQAGVQTGLVLARESFTGSSAEWGIQAGWYVQICRPTALIIGNEMDADLLGVESPSSWVMEPGAYNMLVDSILVYVKDWIYPQPLLIIGGQVAGQPSEWLTGVDIGAFDGVDIHPYGKGPQEMAELLSAYQAIYHLPLYVFEWSRPAEEIPEYVKVLGRLGVQAACYFCWSDAMVPGFGLVGSAEYTVLMEEART